MKPLCVKLGVILFVAGLTICETWAWGEDWREFAEATTGIFFYDKESVKSIPPWVFRVWIHNTSKRETSLIEIDCKEKDYRVLDVVEYSEAGSITDRHMYYDDDPGWLPISQRTVPEPLHSILCP